MYRLIVVVFNIFFIFFIVSRVLLSDVYKPHVLVLRLDLDPKDALPRDLHRPVRVTFHVSDSTASRTQVRSPSLLPPPLGGRGAPTSPPPGGRGAPASPPPLRSVQHVTHYEYGVEVNVSAAVAKRAAATRGGARSGGVSGGRNALQSPVKAPHSGPGRKSSTPPAVKISSSYTSSDSNLSSLESDDEGEYMVKGKFEEDGAKVKDETVLKVTGDEAKVKDEATLKDTADARVKVKEETVPKLTGDAREKVKNEATLKVTGDAGFKAKDDGKVKVVEAKEEEEDGGVSSDRTSSEYD